MSKDCIFCRIASGEIPAEKVFESEELIAFKDINPIAPVHVLIVPKKHIATIDDVDESNMQIFSKMFAAAKEIAKKTGVNNTGYRTIVNCKKDAGQEVFHIHMHVVGGRPLAQMG